MQEKCGNFLEKFCQQGQQRRERSIGSFIASIPTCRPPYCFDANCCPSLSPPVGSRRSDRYLAPRPVHFASITGFSYSRLGGQIERIPKQDVSQSPVRGPKVPPAEGEAWPQS